MDHLTATMSKPGLLPIQFDEFCNILGGQTWARYAAGLMQQGQEQRLKALAHLKPLLFGPNSLLGTVNYPERLALERLYIKVSLITKLCQAIKDSHDLLKKPIGNIQPRTVRINVSPVRSLAPSLWTYHMELGGLGEIKPDRVYSPMYGDELRPDTNPRQDFYSLGMMLFSALLINKAQGVEVIDGAIRKITTKLRQSLQDRSETVKIGQFSDSLSELLEIELAKPEFDQRNVCYIPDHANLVSKECSVWKHLLITGLRLVTAIPGFSYYSSGSSLENSEWKLVDAVLADLNTYEQRIKAAFLYEPLHTDRDLKELMVELINDPEWLSAIGGLETSPDPVKSPAQLANSIEMVENSSHGKTFEKQLTGSACDKSVDVSEIIESTPLDRGYDLGLDKTVIYPYTKATREKFPVPELSASVQSEQPLMETLVQSKQQPNLKQQQNKQSERELMEPFNWDKQELIEPETMQYREDRFEQTMIIKP